MMVSVYVFMYVCVLIRPAGLIGRRNIEGAAGRFQRK